MATRRTKAAPVAIDGGGLAVFYVDCQLAAFPSLPFHEAMKARFEPGVKYKLPPLLELMYPDDGGKGKRIAAERRAFTARYAKLDPNAQEQPAKPLATARLYRRVNYSTSLKHHFQTACPV